MTVINQPIILESVLDLTKFKLYNNTINYFHQKVNCDAALVVFVAVPSSVTQIVTQNKISS